MESILKRWWFGGGAEEAGPLRTALRAFQPPASCFGQGQFCNVLPATSCSAWNLVQNPLNWLNKMGKTTPESLLRPVCDTGHREQDVNRVQRITRACRGCCGRPGFDDKNWMDFCSDVKWSEAKRHLNLQKWSEPLVFLTFRLRNVLRATTACTFSTSEPPKVARTCGVLYILTSKCASRHNGVHFFNIRTSKSGANMWCFVHFDLEMCFAPQRRTLFRHLNFQSGPNLVCFVHFDFKMCFAPQRRTLFRHLNFQKWSEPGVFCTFWFQNVLRATTACTFSTSQLPKVARTPGVFNMLTSKCASRHNGVQLFISHLASWLRTRRFSEPTFRPSGATNHWKNTVFRDFPTFSRICIFFLLIFLFSLPLPCSAFHLSILSEV